MFKKIIVAFILFAVIPAVLIYTKDKTGLLQKSSAPQENTPSRTSPNSLSNFAQSPIQATSPSADRPSPPMPNGAANLTDEEKEKQRAAVKAHMNTIKQALSRVLSQKKYAYVLVKNEGLIDELMRQIQIMIKMKQDKTVEQVVREFIDTKMQADLITPDNESQKLKEVENYYLKKIRGMKYEERKDMCTANGGTFTGSGVYNGDLAEQYLRACVCTSTGSSLQSRPWAKPVLYSLSCAQP